MTLADFLGTTWFIILLGLIGVLAGAWLWKQYGHKIR